MNTRKNNILKVLGGIILMILGTIGVVKSQNVKKRAVRLFATAASVITMLCGFYMFISGVDDLAIARMNETKLGEPMTTSGMVYKNPKDFEFSLASTFTRDEHNKLRRLHFKCPDNSEQFTIYNTAVGVFGVPKHSIECNNGEYLIAYKDELKPI